MMTIRFIYRYQLYHYLQKDQISLQTFLAIFLAAVMKVAVFTPHLWIHVPKIQFQMASKKL